MKKFVINILIFFGIVAVIDFAAGKVFRHIQANLAGGRTGAEYYACKESNEDVIIMGSSRAMHHYVPSIIEDSLGMSCYNAGQDGNGIIMQYGRWKMISERYTPKMVIYDVTPEFDLSLNDNMAYIDRLKPFCDEKEVKNYVADIFPLERLKLISKMYRYNYKFLEMLSDCLRSDNDNQGYFPEYGHVRPEVAVKLNGSRPQQINLDKVKLQYLEALAKECREKNVKLVFGVSPWLKGENVYSEETFAPVADIANRSGAAFEYFNAGSLSDNEKLFKDTYHLNDEGAKAFTAELVSVL